MRQSGKLSNSREGVSTATAKGRPTEVAVLIICVRSSCD